MKFFQAFALAFNMLSIIPFFKVHIFFKGINGYSAMFYPLVGFILGSILYLFSILLTNHIPQPHLAVVIFGIWVTITGAIHLDGFSDSIDGLFVNKEKSLEVMKDPHIGGMGAIFTFVFLAIKLSSIVYFNAYYLLPLILMLSRLNATLAIYFYKYNSDGVGKLIKDELSLPKIIFMLIYSLIFSQLFYSINLFFISILSLYIIASFFQKRLGGLNGDIYGFIIEITELIILNYLIYSSF
jgi:cobalamin 5'-phosphate synthase/cobalamin synthase